MEFKEAAARRLLAGQSGTALSRELEVKRSVLYRWRDAYRNEGVNGLSRRRGRPKPGRSAPGFAWPAPLRPVGSFALTYMAGWTVTPESTPGADDAVNEVPASVRLMIERAVAFRAGSGLGGITIGSLKINAAPTYETDRIPPEIANIARAYQYRPGIFAARP